MFEESVERLRVSREQRVRTQQREVEYLLDGFRSSFGGAGLTQRNRHNLRTSVRTFVRWSC